MEKQLIIICRHSQTDGNKIENKILGRSNDPLNTLGIKQAKQLSKKIKGQKIQVILSSKTKRALQTAKIISQLLHIPVKTDSRLSEYNFGVFAGKILDRNEIYKGIDTPLKRFNYRLPKGESDRDVVKRIKNFMVEIKKKKLNVLVCTHSFPAFVLKNLLNGHKINDFVDLPFESMRHDEIVVIEK
jgi:broad specificity phosphatase PhoE